MRETRVLHVTAARVDVYRVGRGFADREKRFTNDASGLASLCAHLKMQRRAPLRVIADLADEDFHVEHLPLLRGAERREVLSRRLRQRFPDADLAMTISLGRIRGDRREERVMLGAFTGRQPGHAVLAALRQEDLPVTAIHSAAQLAPAMLVKMRMAEPRVLVVAIGAAGLRQTYVEDGRLRFSRLSGLSSRASESEDSAAQLHHETARMHQYLLASGVVQPDANIAVVHVSTSAHPDGSFEPGGDRVTWQSTAFATVARACGLRRWSDQDECEALAAYLAAASASREGYADESLHTELRRERRRDAATWACGVLASASLVATGATVIEASGLRAQMNELRSRTSAARIELEAVSAGLPALPTAVESLRAVERIERELLPLRASMDPLLKEISRSLDAVPQIELESVRWQRGAGPSPANGTDADAESAEIAGRVAGDARAVESFVSVLRQRPVIVIKDARLPFGASPGSRIAGDLGGAPDSGAPTFSLIIARRSGI